MFAVCVTCASCLPVVRCGAVLLAGSQGAGSGSAHGNQLCQEGGSLRRWITEWEGP